MHIVHVEDFFHPNAGYPVNLLSRLLRRDGHEVTVVGAEMIILAGGKPVFVEIEPDICNVDASKIEAPVAPCARAIMPLSPYGQMADMDENNAVSARRGNIPVFEDAAQNFGATYPGRKNGNLGTFGGTSFFPSKALGCYGDGGAIFTSDGEPAQACLEIRVHGQSKRYYHTRVGVEDGRRVLSLPMSADLDHDGQDRAVQIVTRALERTLPGTPR